METKNMSVTASVIIPVYNGKKFVKNCINNLMNQTYKDMEILIVDDGSTDETLTLCEGAKQKYSLSNLHIVSQNNSGVSAARNKGIDKAKGKYLFFFDVDDFEEPELIQACIKQMENNKLDILITGYYFDIPYGQKNDIESIKNIYKDVLYEDKESLHRDFINLWDNSMMYNIWNKVFRKDIVDKYNVRFPEGKAFNEDRDFVREYLRYCERVQVIKKGYYHYIRRLSTATGVYRANLYEIRKEEYYRLKDYFEEFGIKSEAAEEYLARQHVERAIGCVENLFHMSDSTLTRENRKYIKKQIKSIIDDTLMDEALSKTKSKSKKMKILILPYKCKNVHGIYYTTKLIHIMSMRYPELFHKLKQAR